MLRRKIQRAGSSVQVGSSHYDLQAFRDVQIVAIGKAAVPMAEGLLAILDPALRTGQRVKGIVVGASEPAFRDARLLYRAGSHPLPDGTSLDAARAILQLLQETTERTLVFFLISGGASAMVELPLVDDISLGDLTLFSQLLVHSGLPIAEMNALRKHLSAVKGGRLALAAGPATQCTLLVSDVPPSQTDAVGSGPSVPDPSTLLVCQHLLASEFADRAIPQSIRDAFASGSLPETPKVSHSAFARSSVHMLLSSIDLCETAQAVAQEHGFSTVVDLSCDEGNYKETATYLLHRLQELAVTGTGACVVSGGEVSVPLSGVAGIGGRNQHFALECARLLAGSHRATVVLSAGSDGVDGNSSAAGAVVDTTTVQRACARGLSVDSALSSFNAFPLFHAIGDSIITGPTSNNLRDLRLLLQLQEA